LCDELVGRIASIELLEDLNSASDFAAGLETRGEFAIQTSSVLEKLPIQLLERFHSVVDISLLVVSLRLIEVRNEMLDPSLRDSFSETRVSINTSRTGTLREALLTHDLFLKR
jgi:hypothetical protein